MRETMPGKKSGEFAALPHRELPQFMALLSDAAGIAARSLDFALHTASRTGEVLLAEWSEFDLRRSGVDGQRDGCSVSNPPPSEWSPSPAVCT